MSARCRLVCALLLGLAELASAELRDSQAKHFDYVQMPGAEAAGLMSQYHQALDARPHTPDDRLDQVTRMGERYQELAARATAVSLVDDPLGGGDDVFEDDPEQERLDRTRLIMASSGPNGPAALAFVSFWPDHVSIDACAINPDFLAAGELAEKAVISHVTATALEHGIKDIRLMRSKESAPPPHQPS